MRILGPIATCVMAWAFGLLLAAWLSSGCVPQPLQAECSKYKDCSSCVLHYCGWYDKTSGGGCAGCASLKEPRICSGLATVYEPYCRIDPTETGIYGEIRKDGGTP